MRQSESALIASLRQQFEDSISVTEATGEVMLVADKDADRLFDYAQRLPSLTCVSSNVTHDLTDAGLLALAQHPALCDVFLLANREPTRQKLTSAGLNVVASLPALVELDLSGFDSAAIDPACRAVARCRRLRKLQIGGSGLTDQGVSQLEHMAEVLELNLGGGRFKRCPNVATMPKLREFLLGNTLVDDAGLEPLKGHPALVKLDLSGTKITDQAAEILLTIPHLESLYVSETQVTSAFLDKMVEAKKLHTLMMMRIPLDDRAVVALCRYPALKELWVGGRSIWSATSNQPCGCSESSRIVNWS